VVAVARVAAVEEEGKAGVDPEEGVVARAVGEEVARAAASPTLRARPATRPVAVVETLLRRSSSS
jgi:hypothetical protein